jgi:hypothetical protein
MFNHLRQYPVVLLSIIADASYAQRSQLPGVLIINLCYRHIVTTTDAADDGLQYLPLAFEGLVLRQAKPQLAYTKVHMMVIPDAEAIVHWQTFGVQLLPTDTIRCGLTLELPQDRIAWIIPAIREETVNGRENSLF